MKQRNEEKSGKGRN